MKLVLQVKSLLLFLLILAIEICIALFVHDRVVRPYIGDVLAVIGVFYLVQTFVKSSALKIATGSFVFACLVEVAQYIHLVNILGIENNKLLCIILGTGFEWLDIVAYFAGAVTVLLVEMLLAVKNRKM